MRHGQTDWNLAGRVQGHTDIPLNNTGQQQASDAARQFTDIGLSWDLVVSSSLGRAKQTAQIVAEITKVPFMGERESLIEQNYGDAEGSLVEDLPVRWPERNFPHAEADADVGRRGLQAIDDLITEFDGSRVLAVSHGALIRRIISVILDETYENVPRIPNVSVSQLRRTSAGWQVLTVGGTPLEQAILHT